MELETFLLAASLVPAIYLLVHMDRRRSSDPVHVRRFGAAIGRDALGSPEAPEVIGRYDGAPIYGVVMFLGMRYRFDCVVTTSYRYCVGAGELYVEPGLLYVAD